MNNVTWKSQQEKAKCIKDTLQVNEAIYSGDDFVFLNEYFKNHPEYNNKFSDGCIGYVKRNMREWGVNNFCLCIIDDYKMESSISVNFNRKINKKAEVIKAFRSAIYPDVKEFINKYFEPNETKCALSNKIITDSCDFEVDHFDLDFKNALNLFMIDKSFDELYLKVSNDKTVRVFTDLVFIQEWRDFHNKNTQLRFVLKEAHKERTKEQLSKKTT
jgi:hypothetical protein